MYIDDDAKNRYIGPLINEYYFITKESYDKVKFDEKTGYPIIENKEMFYKLL
jgi:hypothetical protein